MHIEVRRFSGEATDSLMGYAARSFYMALRPFAGHVRRVRVSLGKERATYATAAGRCRATIELASAGPLEVRGEGEQPYLVVKRVADDARRAVSRAVEAPVAKAGTVEAEGSREWPDPLGTRRIAA